MRFLRVFDSLKIVRTMFVAIACMLMLCTAHAATLPAGYTELEYLESTGEQYIELSFGFDPTDMIRAKFAIQGRANDKYIVAPNVWNSNNNRFGMGVHLAYYAIGYGNQQTSTTILQPSINNNDQFHEWFYSGYVFSIPELNTSKDVSNITFGTTTSNIRLFYGYQGGTAGKISYYKHIKANGTGVELIPVRRDSDGVLGMYDLADANPATAFYTNAGTGTFIAGEYKIKIATTKYNEAEFAPVQTNLETARTVINNLITQMQTNAVNVSKLAVEKQTRPNADCPAGKNCLLVMDPTGAENWYEIAGADAVQSSLNVPDYFSFTTTTLNAGDSRSFSLTPSGTFTVDWGDGSEPQVIERTNTEQTRYEHIYENAGEKTVKITGRATGYSSEGSRVFTLPSRVISIDGSLGAIFPTLGTGPELQPSFSGLFYNFTGISSIPEHLFDGVYGPGIPNMFRQTFRKTNITEIPAGVAKVFGGITGAAPGMFERTFYETPITSIPAGLFDGVTGAADSMFNNTFANTQITSIPAGLFDGVSGSAVNMFNNTFSRTQITSIPAGLFRGVTGAAESMFDSTFAYTPITSIPPHLFDGVTSAAANMFYHTFDNTSITSIPAGLFSGVTGAADSMFISTFGHTLITSIPAGLFSGVTSAASTMFAFTFASCPNLTGYIPESVFASLIQNNNPNTNYFMISMFYNSTGLATTCPDGTTEVSTPYKSAYWETGNGNYAVMCRPND